MHENKIRFIDLFGGIGGFRKGIEQADDTCTKQLSAQSRRWNENEKQILNRHSSSTPSESRTDTSIFRCVAYYDIDKYATAVYNHNFKEEHKPSDITKVRSEDIPDFDLLCGGFPCQSFSIAGKRRGFEDTRGTLFFEIARILRDKRPKMVFLENVAGLLSHDEGRTFGTILDTLRELGYVGQYQVLNSKNFGVPQNRERVFIIGHLGEGSIPKIFPVGEDGKSINNSSEELREQIANTLRTNYSNGISNETYIQQLKQDGQNGQLHQGIEQLNDGRQGNRLYGTEGISPSLTSHGNTNGGVPVPFIIQLNNPKHSNNRVFGEEGISPALNTMQGGTEGVVQDMRIRRLTPIECERLQGYPDNWTKYGMIGGKVTEMSDTQRYKMCGNSVTVNVIQAIAEKLIKQSLPPQAEKKVKG